MTMLQTLPVIAYLGACAAILSTAMGRTISDTMRWVLPAALGLLFLAFSVATVAQESVLQFWINHTTSLAGNQVWVDLLVAVSICFYLIAPRARAAGMALMPWGIAVVATASIALLPMLARLIWLERKRRD